MAQGVQVITRMSLALKAAIDRAAAQNGTSVSAEVADRLKRTLREDEQRGGSDVLRVQARLNEALRHGGELGADASGVAREKWLTDPVARRVAKAAWLKEWDAIEALLSEQPK
jgi:hypothetical protein